MCISIRNEAAKMKAIYEDEITINLDYKNFNSPSLKFLSSESKTFALLKNKFHKILYNYNIFSV